MNPKKETNLSHNPLTPFYMLVHILWIWYYVLQKQEGKRKLGKMALKRSIAIGFIQGVPKPKNIKILMNF